MPLAQDQFSQKAMGGTELLKYELVRRINELDPTILDHFQIFVSRVHEPLNKDKIIIYWLHDLAEDPAAAEELKNGRWKRFDILVFVSNWQMQQYINRHNIPWSRCIVMENCINPIPYKEKDYSDKIKLIYTPTPHRGLEILIPVFDLLDKKYPDHLHLDVFSSFELYGWGERDKMYEALFKTCREHPSISYHGSQSNDVVREALRDSHIFAYPSIWPETSCLCLIEAMSAGLLCVHSNYGALADTAGGITNMYQMQDDTSNHASSFYAILENTIQFLMEPANAAVIKPTLAFNKLYADARFSWDQREQQWMRLFVGLLQGKDFIIQSRKKESDESSFRFSTN